MYSQNDIAILYLDTLGLTHKNFKSILENLDNPSDIFIAKCAQKVAKFFDEKQFEKIKITTLEDAEKVVTKDLEKFDIFAITIANPKYPTNLKNIDDPPFVLYTRGDTSVLSSQKIGIVGTRIPTNYGRDVANKFSKELSKAGLVTVSGLSYGIDTCCAVSTLQAGGKTIAVLAGGLDSIYPSQNIDLSRKIEARGLLVSEYRPYVRPRQYSFISRNRIISGLSDGLLVVEAGKRSGATSTAMFAVDQGRELFVIPGNISSPQSAGTNELINQMPDCFTISVDQIFDKLHVAKKSKISQKQNLQLDYESNQILALLKQGELHFDDICQKCSLDAQTVAEKLTMLEILGAVHKNAGNYYSIAF